MRKKNRSRTCKSIRYDNGDGDDERLFVLKEPKERNVCKSPNVFGMVSNNITIITQQQQQKQNKK